MMRSVKAWTSSAESGSPFGTDRFAVRDRDDRPPRAPEVQTGLRPPLLRPPDADRDNGRLGREGDPAAPLRPAAARLRLRVDRPLREDAGERAAADRLDRDVERALVALDRGGAGSDGTDAAPTRTRACGRTPPRRGTASSAGSASPWSGPARRRRARRRGCRRRSLGQRTGRGRRPRRAVRNRIRQKNPTTTMPNHHHPLRSPRRATRGCYSRRDRRRFRRASNRDGSAAMTDVRELRELAEKRYGDFVEALREMVNVDCGSFTPEGVNAIADLCQSRFERGCVGRRADAARPEGEQERLGDLVIGRLEGTRSRAGPDDRPHRHGVRPRDRRRTPVPDRGRPGVRARASPT